MGPFELILMAARDHCVIAEGHDFLCSSGLKKGGWFRTGLVKRKPSSTGVAVVLPTIRWQHSLVLANRIMPDRQTWVRIV